MGAQCSSPDWLRRSLTSAAGLALCAAALGGFAAVARSAWPQAVHGPGDPAAALLLVVCAVGGVLAAWTGLGVASWAVSTLPGAAGALAGRVARWSPPLARTVATLLLGSMLGATIGPVAGAAASGTSPRPSPLSPAAADLPAPAFLPTAPPRTDARAHGPLPDPGFGARPSTVTPRLQPPRADLPTPGWAPARPDRPTRHEVGLGVLAPGRHAGRMPTLDRVVVRKGDSLWTIAARHLGPGATTAEVAREWPRWHDANREVIGDDPALLVPGQQLEPPSPNRGRS